MPTGNMEMPQDAQAGRRRRSERYYTPQMPGSAPSADGVQEIPVPKAMQRAHQTGAQQPMNAGPAAVRAPAAAFDPERPRRQTGAHMPVQPVAQAYQAGAQMPAQMMRQAGMQVPAQAMPPVQQMAYHTGAQVPMQQMPVRQTGMQMPAQPVAPMQQPMYPGGAQMPMQNQGFGWQQNGLPLQAEQVRFGQNMGGQPPVPPQGGFGGAAYPGGPGGKKRGSKTKRTAVIALMAVLAAAIIAAAAIGIPAAQRQQAMVASVNAYNDRYCEGVFVDGIALGGMTQQEAAEAVIRQAQQRTDSWSVRLTYQGQLVSQINAGMLGMNVDVQDALMAAWEQGHTGTAEERAAAMDALRATPFEAWTAQPSSDTSVIDRLLENIRLQVYRVPKDAAVTNFNPSSSDPFTFSQEVPGRMLDVAPIKEQVYHMLATMTSGDIEVTPTYVQPSVTVADLQKTVRLRASAYTEISTTSDENRNNNIRRAFEMCTGTILKPGDVFSFNDRVGKRTKENGFFPAPEYVAGELTEGIGGGVCQASTTLMQAALKAGLTLTDHTPHSEKANYADYGMDATVYWEYGRKIDMKFKNNTEGNIYIVCSVQSNPNNRKRLIAKVDIYGMELVDTRYDLTSVMVEELPFEQKVKRDKDKKYVNYDDETKVTQTGRIGYIYDTYRLTIVNGVEVGREYMFQSTYKSRDEITYVGTSARPME